MIPFPVFNASDPILFPSPSPFEPVAWSKLLQPYPGDLLDHLLGILRHGCRVGYEGPLQKLISENHGSCSLVPQELSFKLTREISLGRTIKVNPAQLPFFISSPLGLVPEGNGGFRRIQDLSFPPGTSVNAFIPKAYNSLEYTTIYEIYDAIVAAGKGC
ncbi:hypothetical protein K3495_g13731 [Podosphaera aphanis]|nr:hypothetical protein K3495_g13731 [Podosphaera aphanis]